MSIEGVGAPGGLPLGPTGPRPSAALLPLVDALALLGLPARAGKDEVGVAHRTALTALQAQARAGSLDQGSFRAQAAQLDLAVRSIRAANAPSGGPPLTQPAMSPLAPTSPRPGQTATSPPPQPTSLPPSPSGMAPPAGVVARTTPTAPEPSSVGGGAAPAGPLTQPAPDDPPAAVATSQRPPAGPAPQGPVTSGAPSDLDPARPDSPRIEHGTPTQGTVAPAPAAARAGTPAEPGSGSHVLGAAGSDPAGILKTMPLRLKPAPSPAQLELWNATVVPAAERHADTAHALATAVAPRSDPLWHGIAAHGALTLALADLSPDQRRALRAVAPGVYDQLEAVLPRAVLSGLPPRDHLGLLPFQTWIPGADIKPALLLLLVGLVVAALWASQR